MTSAVRARRGLSAALEPDVLLRAMAAHSPLSAVLAQEAGFDAVWASGFEISALHGLADVSLLTMTQHLDVVRAIAARCEVPIVADIDTGYGNAVNVIHAVKQYELAGASAVVIEDKTFPKCSSLLEGARQELVRVQEFQGKLEAAIHARRSKEFLIIGRTEALIAGLEISEALRRAEAYAEAGADMILVHSKARTPDQIEAFLAAWNRPQRLVVVPTSYPQLDEGRIRSLGTIGMVIYGNQAIRASVRAMREVFRNIAISGGALGVEGRLASVDEIFALQQMDEIRRQESQFLK